MSMIGNFRRVPTRLVEELLADPSRVTSVLYEDAQDASAQLDIDKAWHGIHFLLTGEVWEGELPLGFIMAGEPIGDVDVGYGPARGLTSTEVRAIAAALAPITRETLRERFDPEALEQEDVYPSIWEEGDDALDYLLEHFDALKQFVTAAAQADEGMLVFVN